jgi:hypothetical protein
MAELLPARYSAVERIRLRTECFEQLWRDFSDRRPRRCLQVDGTIKGAKHFVDRRIDGSRSSMSRHHPYQERRGTLVDDGGIAPTVLGRCYGAGDGDACNSAAHPRVRLEDTWRLSVPGPPNPAQDGSMDVLEPPRPPGDPPLTGLLRTPLRADIEGTTDPRSAFWPNPSPGCAQEQSCPLSWPHSSV